MNLRKAAEMALEALEMTADKFQVQRNAITELRQALAQPDEVLAEREACAKVCEAMDHNGVMIAKDCAAAIRARGEK